MDPVFFFGGGEGVPTTAAMGVPSDSGEVAVFFFFFFRVVAAAVAAVFAVRPPFFDGVAAAFLFFAPFVDLAGLGGVADFL